MISLRRTCILALLASACGSDKPDANPIARATCANATIKACTERRECIVDRVSVPGGQNVICREARGCELRVGPADFPTYQNPTQLVADFKQRSAGK